MNNRERFFAAMRYQPADYRPIDLVGAWPDTLARWHREGLPEGVNVHELLGVSGVKVANISCNTSLHPPYEERVLEEGENHIIAIDHAGRTVRKFKDHTSMPEWLDFPVKTPEDLQRVLDEHYSIEDLGERFSADWEEKALAAGASDAVVLIDGGCYYWTLRELAGVEYASYLFYDAPELVDELFERYFTVVMEGMRRAVKLVQLDAIGFGEDVAYKTGPLISPAMLREFILPRYAKTMEFAHANGVEFTWYDSDGDLRQFIPDYLDIGINGIAPCEVAANMSPVELRETFGRDLRMFGGVDKREIARGRAAIDAEIDKLRPLIEEGGFLPGIDHSVPADISFSDYCYFIERLKNAVGMG